MNGIKGPVLAVQNQKIGSVISKNIKAVIAEGNGGGGWKVNKDF